MTWRPPVSDTVQETQNCKPNRLFLDIDKGVCDLANRHGGANQANISCQVPTDGTDWDASGWDRVYGCVSDCADYGGKGYTALNGGFDGGLGEGNDYLDPSKFDDGTTSWTQAGWATAATGTWAAASTTAVASLAMTTLHGIRQLLLNYPGTWLPGKHIASSSSSRPSALDQVKAGKDMDG